MTTGISLLGSDFPKEKMLIDNQPDHEVERIWKQVKQHLHGADIDKR